MNTSAPHVSTSDVHIEVLDEGRVGFIASDTQVRLVCSGMRWTEGPLFLPDQQILLFSDIPNNRIMRWSAASGLSIHLQPSNFANGRTLDRQGNVVTCEHGTRSISITRPDGARQVMVDRYEGKRLNSPNDVIVDSDDVVWFTDPPYGIESDYEGYLADSEIGANYVYRFDRREGRLSVVADDFDRPNGLAFSPDEKLLYVADSGASLGAAYADPFVADRAHHIRVFDVEPSGRLKNGRVFVDIDSGVPDGIKVDCRGNVWSSAWDGVRCYAPSGDLVARIVLREITSNLNFADSSCERLFITASTSVYEVSLKAAGAVR